MEIAAILRFLAVPRRQPSVEYLDLLLDAYTRAVPWESAFRIARRAMVDQPEDRPRWPDIFWADALERGGGGTCFESNYGFFALLSGLGFRGYLTINDMGESVGCHTAVVVEIDGQKRLADVGYPLYRSLMLNPTGTTSCVTRFHTFSAIPQGNFRYEIRRDRHPKPYVFTLIDQPVADEAYRRATRLDYEPGGHFNDEVIVHKVIGDRIWRFNGRAQPPLLESFPANVGEPPTLEELTIPDAAARLAPLFQMDSETVAQAFATVYPRSGSPSLTA